MCVITDERATMNTQPRGCPVYLSQIPSFRVLRRIKVMPVPVILPVEQRMLSHGPGEDPNLAIKRGDFACWYGGCFRWSWCGSSTWGGKTGGPSNQAMYHTRHCGPHTRHLEYFITDFRGLEEWEWVWLRDIILQFHIKLKYKVTSPNLIYHASEIIWKWGKLWL